MRTPDWQTEDGSIRLFCGDCLDVLPNIETSCVDAVVADIPYAEVNRESSGLRSLDKGIADIASFSIDDAVRMACVGQSAYVFCCTEQVSALRSGFVCRGMTTRLCIWEKSNPSPMNGECLWLSSIECCIFARRSRAYFAEHCASPVWRGPICRNQVHKTQKPTWLIQKIVSASVPPQGSALDFCMGSGTTGVACIRLGRRFIGIEKERKYFDIAVKRITDELGKLRLFEPPPKIVQRSLLDGDAP